MHRVTERLREAEQRTVPPGPFDLDASLRRVRGKARRRRVALSVSGLVAAAVVVIGSAVIWPDNTTGSPEFRGPAASVAGPRDMLDVLNTPQEAEDRLPAEVVDDPNFADSYVVPESVRFLAEHDRARYWAGMSTDGYACLVMLLPVDKLNVAPEDDWSWYSMCGGISGPGMESEAEGVRTRLVPDDYEPSEADRSEWTFLTPNLAVEKD